MKERNILEVTDLNENSAVPFHVAYDVFSANFVPRDLSDGISELVRIREDEDIAGQKPLIKNGEALEEQEIYERTEDLVQTYFHSLGDISVLTRDEEASLARQIEEGNKLIERIVSSLPAYGEENAGNGNGAINCSVPNKKDRAPDNRLEILDKLMTCCDYEHIASATGAHIDEFKMKYKMITRARAVISEAKNELIIRNLRLVINIAKHYTGRGLFLLDLIQEGNIGLMKAIDKFDYKKGFKFSTYATWWIRQAIAKALIDQTKTIRVPSHTMELYNEIVKVSRELISHLGREPLTEEIAERLCVSSKKVENALRAIQDPIALQTTVGDDDTPLEDFIGDNNNPSPYSDTESKKLTEQVLKILHTLTDREEAVIRMRFGIATDRTYTLREIGRCLSITCERVRQIEAKALRKLKHPKRSGELKALTAG